MSERAIVVGAGGISGAWFPPLIEEQVDIVAVVDLNADNAQARVQQYGLQSEASADLEGMLKKHQPDFVVDLTIPEAHCAVTCTALKAGCHVIGEKPMAASMEEARKMVRTAEEAGKLYMVSQSRRWEERQDRISRTLSSGEVGTLTTVNCDFYIGAHFGGFRDEMPSPLILDMSIHQFDLLRYFTGADPVAVYAKEFNPKGSWYKGDVAASCIFEMSNGLIFTFRGSWCAEGCHTSWHGDWRFIGDQGTMVFAGDKDPYGQVVDGEGGFHRPMRDLVLADARPVVPGMHGALCEMLTFLRTGQKPQTECHDNIKSLAMVFAAMESSRAGQRVPVQF
ncbi:MAG: Gfo/Idh/MocA family protein [Armatimonadota bacterium]